MADPRIPMREFPLNLNLPPAVEGKRRTLSWDEWRASNMEAPRVYATQHLVGAMATYFQMFGAWPPDEGWARFRAEAETMSQGQRT